MSLQKERDRNGLTELALLGSVTDLEKEFNDWGIAVLTGQMECSVIGIILLVDIGVGGSLSDQHLDNLTIPLPRCQVKRRTSRVVRDLS